MKRRKIFISLFLLAFVLGSVLVSCDTSVDNGTDDYTYTYTITFNANDGTANPATTTQTFSYPSSSYSASVILKANTFTRSGYTFVGWAKYTDSNTADYEDGATATFSYDTTLYAVWKSDSFAYSYTITFEGNGGITSSGETKTTQVAAGNTSSVKATLNPNPFAKSGYVFVGWSSYASSTSASYTEGSSYSAYSNTTLYAVWASQADVLTVTLDANDGSGKTSKITTTKNSYIYFSSYADVFTQDYATLTGFNTQADGEGTDYSVDSMSSKSLKVTENSTLYANWKYNPCIIFNGNGGTTTDGITETKQYQDGHYEYLGIYWNFVPKNVDSSAESETVKLNGNPFTRDGYVFKGWSTSPSVSSPTYTDKQSVAAFTKSTVLFTIWSGKTLYAVWEKIQIPTITYNMNGGSNTDTFTVKSKSITDTVPSAKYSYYMFLGWSSSKNATTASYTSGDEYPYTTDTTLYAVWKLRTIFNSKAVSVARNSTETIGTFTLLKSESVKLTISNVEDDLTYVATPASGTAVEFGKLSSATTVTKTLSAGTYTLTAKNAEVIGSANTATVTLKGN